MQNEVRSFFNDRAQNWDRKEVKDSKWLTCFIEKYVPLSKGMKVLDLGCGTGIISQIIFDKTKTNVTALDVSDYMISIAKQKYKDTDITFYNEDFYLTRQKGFDMVLCFNAYPHFTDVDTFQNKAKDVLKNNGFLVILHSLSRNELSLCHKGHPKNISRELHSVEEEVTYYQNDFNVVEMIDNDEMFLMILRKK